MAMLKGSMRHNLPDNKPTARCNGHAGSTFVAWKNVPDIRAGRLQMSMVEYNSKHNDISAARSCQWEAVARGK
jgi:hypothetical protein